jgi:hypothetical protein
LVLGASGRRESPLTRAQGWAYLAFSFVFLIAAQALLAFGKGQ